MLARRELDGGVAAIVSETLESDGFLVAFTERSGGTSTGPFESLNLGFGTPDGRALVAENRRRVSVALGLDEFACARQAHGSRVALVEPAQAGAGFMDPATAVAGVDALVTSEPGMALAVMVADCVPVALAHPGRSTLAVVHAGWRGVAGGVVAEAIASVGDPTGIRAVIGPAIGPDHYEVGEDVLRAVSSGGEPAAAHRRRGRLMLDLSETVARILRGNGVRSVERSDVCTACQADRFFSHRRDGGRTGRQALVAVRL